MNNLDGHQGWMILSRAILHTRNAGWEHETYGETIQVLDHCRHLILVDEYPDNDGMTLLLAESTARIARGYLYE